MEAIRIFVTPKNEGIDIILPGMSKEMKDELFLNLLSHLYSADVATHADFIFLFFVHLYLNHEEHEGHKGH